MHMRSINIRGLLKNISKYLVCPAFVTPKHQSQFISRCHWQSFRSDKLMPDQSAGQCLVLVPNLYIPPYLLHILPPDTTPTLCLYFG